VDAEVVLVDLVLVVEVAVLQFYLEHLEVLVVMVVLV
jgi:hypothetical protein